jgi:hypothetical protein
LPFVPGASFPGRGTGRLGAAHVRPSERWHSAGARSDPELLSMDLSVFRNSRGNEFPETIVVPLQLSLPPKRFSLVDVQKTNDQPFTENLFGIG